MYFRTEEEQFRVLLKLSLIALYILTAYDLAILAIGYLAIQSNAVRPGPPDTMIRNALFLVAIGELAAAYFVKKSMLRQAKARNYQDPSTPELVPYPDLLKITVIITSLCSAISTYGLVLIFLGERFEMLFLFVAMSLVGYQVFRLRPRDFKESE